MPHVIPVTPGSSQLSLLGIVERFCNRTGITAPNTVMGSSDPQITQIRALLEEEGNDLCIRGDWESLTNEAILTTIANEDQGEMITIAGNGFRKIKDDTFFNRTNGTLIDGPLSDKEWQATKALASTGTYSKYRIRGGRLLVTPTPAAGESWAFEYISDNWIYNSNDIEHKQYFTLDDDLLLLPEEVLLLGLRWRWKKEKGLDYAEDFKTYEAKVSKYLGHDGSKKILSLDGGDAEPRPTVFIPSGNFI